ncbi:aldehyde dehydrogenase [Streptococcus iniae]|uniref:aldehyde dehydrogenase family protein n=1 Tax=Streptococcus iniae TaxID=1346 RepID=UPI0008D8EB8D|nr:aldehyde dehydrogenase family protein [Streptococcus iniae]OHX27031.1 aldehyde dehydrogenase [Streptococcus iniae]RLV28585.1 aldehyde dehydrogenase [Streptococcus iniae]
MRYIDKDLDSIQETRNLLLNAKSSFLQLQSLNQSDLDTYSKSFISQLSSQADALIHAFTIGNDYGVEKDEGFLCHTFLQRFSDTFQNESYVGIVAGDADDKVIEIGVPLGVVAVLLPSHPSFSLVVNLILIAIKSGNAMILVANKQSKLATLTGIKELIALTDESGYLSGAISLAEIVSDAGISELLASDKLDLLVNIGCPEYISKEFKSNTPCIFGGESSGPVFIERSADIEQAVRDVIYSRSFHNGILPGAEQFLVTENIIAQPLKASLTANGAYLLTTDERRKLITFLKVSEKNISNNYMGKSAKWIAKMAGILVPESTKVLVCVQDYLTEEDYFSQKLLCPIIVVYLEPDWTLACSKCMSLLSELRMGHTLTIHSTNWQVIQEFAMVKAVGRIVVNAPTSCAATGLTSSFPPSLILGGITTGRGYSSENMTPKHWTYTRRVGFKLEK